MPTLLADFENIVKAAVEQGGNVEVRIRPIYNRKNNTLRPNKIQTEYRVDGGAWIQETFKNKAGG